jgi:hypothetical protein
MTQSYFDAKTDFRNISSKVKQQPNSRSYNKTSASTHNQKTFGRDILGFYESEDDDKDVSIMDSLNNISNFLGGGGANSNGNSFN